MKRIPLILLLIFGLVLAGCSAGGAGGNADASGDAADAAGSVTGSTDAVAAAGNADGGTQPLRVVATIFPPYDFTRAVAGDVPIELTMLLSPGAESHSYDPSPHEILAIQDCDLFLYIGGDTDIWVDNILAAMDTENMNIIAMMDLVDAVEEEIVEGMEHGHDDEDHAHDDERELDEHVWTSPRNAAVIVQAIADALCGMDGDNADSYRQNAADYIARIGKLDAAFTELTAGAVRNTLVFGDRFPFRYFADAYGLEYFAAFPGCSTETEASAATVAFLIDKVRDEEIPVVFHIELSSARMAQTISEDTGAASLLLHSCHNITRDDFEAGVTYVDLMWQNHENLKEALT